MNGIKDWNNHDVKIYSIMCCCDWCPKLYGCKEKLHELMKELSMGMNLPGLIQESMETQAVTAVEVTVIWTIIKTIPVKAKMKEVSHFLQTTMTSLMEPLPLPKKVNSPTISMDCCDQDSLMIILIVTMKIKIMIAPVWLIAVGWAVLMGQGQCIFCEWK